MYSSFYYFFIIFTIILIVSICCVTAYFTIDNTNLVLNSNYQSYILSSDFVWPVPGFTKITSPFGSRIMPTSRCFYFSLWN